MTTKHDPYASEEETKALLVPDTRSAAERKLAAMMAERGADEQGAEPSLILRQIALELLEAQTTFTGLPKRKLDMLLKADWRINGVSIEYTERDGTVLRGAVTTGGMVLWWNQEQAPVRIYDYVWPQRDEHKEECVYACSYTPGHHLARGELLAVVHPSQLKNAYLQRDDEAANAPSQGVSL